MLSNKRFSITLAMALIAIFLGSGQAQTPRINSINITAESDKVHFDAQGDVSEMRVEVSDESGDAVFESGAISGGTLDWKMTDSQGERVKAGTYLVTVTFRTAAGKLRKRVEQVTVADAEEKAAAREGSRGPTPEAVQAAINGTGTNGRIAKFTGGSTIGNSVIVESAGKIGIGSIAPTSLLHVITSDAKNSAITGRNNADLGTGVFGYALTGFGVVGQSAYKTGVLGTSSSGDGVVGTTNSGTGVAGGSNEGNGMSGVSGIGIGVFGQSKNGIGVRGVSSTNTGVSGESPNATGVVGISRTSNGVFGRSTNGFGVFGRSTSGAGVVGVSYNQPGVNGESDTSDGVSGYSRTGTGVLGESVFGWAARFHGDVLVTGNLSKSGGSFKIDHPLDPANKYLSHSFVESPDMMNIYNGNITTDARGRAVVTLPAYFAALNRDYRYQLTVIGQFAQAIVAEKIEGNRFAIETDKPNVEVSWQVTGVRKDAWANKHRITVEQEKTGAERGTYLNPEVFSQPKDKRVGQAGRATQTRPTTAATAQSQTESQQ